MRIVFQVTLAGLSYWLGCCWPTSAQDPTSTASSDIIEQYPDSIVALSHYLTYYSYDNHLKKLRKVLHERKQNHISLLTETVCPQSTVIHQTQGGYFRIWIELPKNVCVEALYDKALEYNISVAPGIIFSGDKRFNHHIRPQ